MLSDDGDLCRPLTHPADLPREDRGKLWDHVAVGEPERGRPSGTVAFLLTDVEDSTPLWDRNPASMGAALAAHDAILASAVGSHGGQVFSTAGDALSAAFDTPGQAVSAALQAQRRLQAAPWPADAALRVRMGVHLGVAQERDGDYFGSAVNRAARLMSLAHGGQVLVSLAVAEVVRDTLPAGVSLRHLGEHRLRGLARSETVFQLVAPGLFDDFPPVRAALSSTGTLPKPPTKYVGRTAETKRVGVGLLSHRLLTLVGPGGVGKTRLSIEAATAVVEEFPDGVWFVELAPVAEPSAVVHTMAAVLSVSPDPGANLLESIVRALADRRALLVLDNCEHVLDSAADIAASIGRGAPNATILASSREPLGIAGEKVIDVAPLHPTAEAVELFVDRAGSLVDGFVPSEDDVALIRGICERLDGMPLAIELAAGRVRSMSLEQLAHRLEDCFRVLRSPTRGGSVERHQTLRATIDWSYRLLSEVEQVLLDRLSLFAGPFELEAAEAVCAFDAVDRLEIADLVASLADKSLVSLERDSGRYRLLHTLRQYGAERLAARGEAASRRANHMAHFRSVAARARAWYEGDRDAEGRALFESSWDDLRAALDYAETTGDHAAARGIVRDTFFFATWTGRSELGQWTQRRLGPDSGTTAVDLAMAGLWMLIPGGDDNYRQAEALALRAIEAAGDADSDAAAFGWLLLVASRWFLGRREEAWAADLTAKRLAASLDDRYLAVHIGAWSAPTAMMDPLAGPGLVAAASARWGEAANEAVRCYLAYHEAFALGGAGRWEQAMIRMEECVELAARTGSRSIESAALAWRAMHAHRVGGEADIFRDALDRAGGLKHGAYVTQALIGLATWWHATNRLDEAARVVGFLAANEAGWLTARLSASADRDAGRAGLRAAGAAMGRDEIVAYCLERL